MPSLLSFVFPLVLLTSLLPAAAQSSAAASAQARTLTTTGTSSTKTHSVGLTDSALGGSRRIIANQTIRVSFRHDGSYFVYDKLTAIRLAGHLPAAVASLAEENGRDALGKYREIRVAWGTTGRTAVIRLYADFPAVLFIDRHTGADSNASPFPEFSIQPKGLLDASYRVVPFSPIEFGKLASQGPWLFFNRQRKAMVLSPADNFLVSSLVEGSDGAVKSSIDVSIATLPRGFSHGTLVVFGRGINRTLLAWGQDLQKLQGKRAVANDVDVVLKKFGYWTDNGATYYYKFDPKLGYEDTLLAVRDAYRRLGVPIAYMQLDSWWYPKAQGNTPRGDNGEVVYRADPKIFPDGLDGFDKRLGLPLVTHARGIALTSPYHHEYAMSNNVVIDPRFWNSTAAYLKAGGVVAYEQDWLGYTARPAINIAQSHQFLAAMAAGMARQGIGIQYCMALPAYFMASTQFQNVRTIRASGDRFSPSHYNSFLYTSALAHAVGLWPWSDVFMSSELSNLVVSTLSAGPVGVGDPLTSIDAVNLKRAIRSDSVILKPDTPLVPIDAIYLADAATADGAVRQPMIASTRTNFGSATELYVFSYPRAPGQSRATVALSDLGLSQPVYAWNWVMGKGEVIKSGSRLEMQYKEGWSYEVLVPINQDGIALLGDTTRIVPLARKRFTSVSNRGQLEATLVFAPGEASVKVSGYAAAQPVVHATKGRVDNFHYDSTTHLFSFDVSPGVGLLARIGISRGHS